MPGRRGTLPLEYHRALGHNLHWIRNYLLHEHVRIANTYGVSKKVARLGERAYRALDELRSEMEEEMFRDAPAWPPADREAIATHPAGVQVYYPGTRPDPAPAGTVPTPDTPPERATSRSARR